MFDIILLLLAILLVLIIAFLIQSLAIWLTAIVMKRLKLKIKKDTFKRSMTVSLQYVFASGAYAIAYIGLTFYFLNSLSTDALLFFMLPLHIIAILALMVYIIWLIKKEFKTDWVSSIAMTFIQGFILAILTGIVLTVIGLCQIIFAGMTIF